MDNQEVDILIVGGGLNGAALFHALRDSGLRVVLVDAQEHTPAHQVEDLRTLTLSIASMRIFQHLGLWSTLDDSVVPIRKIHVSEQGRFGTACLEQPNQDPLGYVIPIQALVNALYQDIPKEALLVPAKVVAFDLAKRCATVQENHRQYQVKAKLFVAADGSYSSMREFCQLPVTVKEYEQEALVTHVMLARPHTETAYERFTSVGALALLPVGQKRMGLVWALSPHEAKRLAQLEDAAFLRHIHQVFGYRLGRIVSVGRRMTFPLRQMLMPTQIVDGVVFIGNAAHTLHPVAGQGFNLGLRDVATLAQMIKRKGLLDPTLLTSYQADRRHDQAAITQLTDGLVRIYGHSHPGLRIARQFGLLALDNNRFLKKILARYASGLAGIVPDLVCGID